MTVNFTIPNESLPAQGVVGDAPGGLPPDERGGIAPPAASDANQRAVRVRVSQGLMAALLLTKIPPEYPPAAKDQRIQGGVLLAVIVDRLGNVSNIQLISGHPKLAPAAA